MDNGSAAKLHGPVGVIAAAAIAVSALFAGSGVSVADPYDDDGGSSYSDGGDDGGGVQEAPSGGGMEEPAGGGVQEEPNGGGMPAEPATPDAPGGQEAPGSEPNDDPNDAGAQEVPGGADEPGSGGGQEAPSDDGESSPGGGAQEPSAAGEIAEPEQPQASSEDIATAQSSEVTTTTSSEVSSEEITSYQESVSSLTTSSLTTELALSSPVALWNSSWISYDRWYRPVFTNPYRTPLSVVYDYGGQTQVFTVAPLQRAVLDVPTAGVYNFTAMTRPASGPATNLSVGSFSGGGYQPAAGQAPPQKPAPLNTKKNVLVQVKFDRGSSEPFRVKTLTDLGADPGQKGMTKVLLDEEIPAWGQWSKTAKGEEIFVINQTQLLPGINRPGQEPLPGYNVKLTASTESTSWFDSNKTWVIGGVLVGVLALAGVGLLVSRRRRADG
ncbi:hypothetical protein ACXDF8_20585 [Mycolicibacterium sp. CBM1]